MKETKFSRTVHNILPTATSEEINDLLTALKKEAKNDDEFYANVDDKEKLEGILVGMMNTNSMQYAFLKEAIAYMNKESSSDSYKDATDEENVINMCNREITVDVSKLKTKQVSGKEAQYMILAKGKHLKRINLYNSGFNLVLRAPSLTEIDLVYNQLAEEQDLYGKMFGAAFYMYSDYYIKAILWDFIYSLVLDSNLKKWNKGARLRKAVSLHDYNNILLQIGALMFKNGYPFTNACTEDKCRHVNETIVNLQDLQLTDFSKIPDDQFHLFSSNDTISLTDALKYQRMIADSIADIPSITGYTIDLKIPAMDDYIVAGNAFNTKMMESIKDIKDEDIVNEYLLYSYSKVYLPWIEAIHDLDDNGNINFTVSDSKSITTALDVIQLGEDADDFRSKVMNPFIQKSLVTHIAYLAEKCPKCGILPSNLVEGFVPFDAQHHFFNHLVARLVQTS